MRLTQEWLEAEWPRIIADAGVDADRIQLVIVPDRRPANAAEAAYWAPSFHGPLDRDDVYLVVRYIGDLSEVTHHLVVVWEELPTYDEETVAALLRHEVEHAAQWERQGPLLLDDLDPELWRVGTLSGHSYSERPAERAANDAARDYVRRHYGTNVAATVAQLLPWNEAQEGDRNLNVRVESEAALRAWAPTDHKIKTSDGVVGSVDDFLESLGDGGPPRPNPHDGEMFVFLGARP